MPRRNRTPRQDARRRHIFTPVDVVDCRGDYHLLALDLVKRGLASPLILGTQQQGRFFEGASPVHPAGNELSPPEPRSSTRRPLEPR